FAGTARYYARYRPPYPAALLDDLCRRAGVSGAGRLLDLGCGPGRVALPLASRFREVVAVDLEPEMIKVGGEEAGCQGVANVKWSVGRVEDVSEIAGSCELITMGEAFHRFDQPLILRRALEWLQPGGCLATLGGTNALLKKGEAPWQRKLAEVWARWEGKGVAGGHPTAVTSTTRYGDLMAEAGFEDLGDHDFDATLTWDVDSLIGNAYSSSVMSRRALGERAAGFEADMRRTMLALEPGGRFTETFTFGYTLARKPGE
ncbi:MAG: class I SAM-dependent methyltransferase, partial [bacterium]